MKLSKVEREVGPERKKLEVVMVSDTHGRHRKLKPILDMKGDIFIHAGDFTDYGVEQDFLWFFDFLDQLVNFRYKIVIAGNHQISLDNGCILNRKKEIYLNKYQCKQLTRDQIIRELRKRCIYLEHESVEIEGVRIFGSPYTPYFVGNAFQYRKEDEKFIWSALPLPGKVDLLVTHGPPFGILDKNALNKSAGSQMLRQEVVRLRPKYHVFGHIHESAGMMKTEGITFLNVANQPTRILI